MPNEFSVIDSSVSTTPTTAVKTFDPLETTTVYADMWYTEDEQEAVDQADKLNDALSSPGRFDPGPRPKTPHP